MLSLEWMTRLLFPLNMNCGPYGNSLSEEDQKIVLEAADFTDDPDFGWDAGKKLSNTATMKSYYHGRFLLL